MKNVLDSHTHTLASGHAYNTITEMTNTAKAKGLELLAITEHAPSMPGTSHEFYFQNLRILDRLGYALPTLFGTEVNILDENGTVDMEEQLLSNMDVAVASLHPPCVRFMNKQEVTHSIIKVLENPNIQIIGHLDDDRFPVDYDEVARAAAFNHKLFEVNNSSLAPTSYRPGAYNNYLKLLAACQKHGVEIILNSDAHVDSLIASTQFSLPLITDCNFPEESIVNDSVSHYLEYMKEKTKKYFMK